jgi:hypothetical protein
MDDTMHSSATRTLALTAAAACGLLAVTTLSPAEARPTPHARAGSAPVLKADYRFEGTLKSSVNGAPRLRNVGDGNSFVRVRVPGEGRTKVLQFPNGNGLKVDTDGLIPAKRYSVVLTFRLASAGADDYARVLNPTLPADDNDNGLYLYNNYMTWYDEGSIDGTEGTVTPGEFVEVAFTRNSAGRIRVYVNGQPDISYLETDGQAVIQNHNLRFFVDNSNAESSAGKVARIRLWNDALSARKVKRIYNQATDGRSSVGAWRSGPRSPAARPARRWTSSAGTEPTTRNAPAWRSH